MSGLHDLAAAALRTLDPEDAHRLTIRALALGLGPRAPAPDPILATTVAGLSLPSAVGLAAGLAGSSPGASGGRTGPPPTGIIGKVETWAPFCSPRIIS